MLRRKKEIETNSRRQSEADCPLSGSVFERGSRVQDPIWIVCLVLLTTWRHFANQLWFGVTDHDTQILKPLQREWFSLSSCVVLEKHSQWEEKANIKLLYKCLFSFNGATIITNKNRMKELLNISYHLSTGPFLPLMNQQIYWHVCCVHLSI